jgi:glucose-1-phosphate thymidylyltransferase
VIEGPAIIGERTRIERSRIGPCTSLGPDCRVADSEIFASVVMDHTTIERVAKPIVDSLIGRSVELREDGEAAFRLVLGDFSRARVP